jgi:hypothetical protein
LYSGPYKPPTPALSPPSPMDPLEPTNEYHEYYATGKCVLFFHFCILTAWYRSSVPTSPFASRHWPIPYTSPNGDWPLRVAHIPSSIRDSTEQSYLHRSFSSPLLLSARRAANSRHLSIPRSRYGCCTVFAKNALTTLCYNTLCVATAPQEAHPVTYARYYDPRQPFQNDVKLEISELNVLNNVDSSARFPSRHSRSGSAVSEDVHTSTTPSSTRQLAEGPARDSVSYTDSTLCTFGGSSSFVMAAYGTVNRLSREPCV